MERGIGGAGQGAVGCRGRWEGATGGLLSRVSAVLLSPLVSPTLAMVSTATPLALRETATKGQPEGAAEGELVEGPSMVRSSDVPVER